MTQELLYDKRDDIGWITFNRPQARNALTFAMYEGLAEICGRVGQTREAKALVITGAGDKAFAAGTDIAQFQEFKGGEDGIAYERKMDRVLDAIERCRVPTIAAIAGFCTGGGAAIAAVCDLRLATTDAQFGFPIARTLGNCLSMSNISRFGNLLGAALVKDLIFTARLMEAPEALSAGVVSEVVEDVAALQARVDALAKLILGHAPLTMETAKEALHRLQRRLSREEGRDLILKCYLSEDFREGMDAFLNKRTPHWKGR